MTEARGALAILPAAPSPAPAQPAPSAAPRCLWLAMHFPLLPVHVTAGRALSDSSPCGVFETHGNVQQLVTVNAIAGQAGVTPGMKVSEAWVYAPSLRIFPRNREREQTRLRELGDIASRFSSAPSLHEHHCLLLEIAGSLRLFGGIEALSKRLQGEIEQCEPFYVSTVCPTPSAALLCARGGISARVEKLEELRSVVGDIPVSVFEPERETRKTLARMGIRQMRDLLRLPRRGLHKRFGRQFSERLEGLLGQRPEPQQLHTPTLSFRQEIFLDEESTDLNTLVEVNFSLLRQLEQLLYRHDSHVRVLRWQLILKQQRVDFEIRPGLSMWRAREISTLFRLRLEGLRITSPVRGICLEGRRFEARSGDHVPLFNDLPPANRDTHMALIDRIRSRLGSRAIRGLTCQADYRPERAWSFCQPGSGAGQDSHGGSRPLWLLDPPRALNGPLEREFASVPGGTEKICCGWWDHAPVHRDYRQMITRRNQRLWIYRDHASGGWFVQGIY